MYPTYFTIAGYCHILNVAHATLVITGLCEVSDVDSDVDSDACVAGVAVQRVRGVSTQ